MATRATYRFIKKGITTVIYNHWDGYPEGAAEHLDDVFTAEDFIRKNENSEITKSHEFHGDTEYRYDITTRRGGKKGFYRIIIAKKRVGFGDEWEQFYHGYLHKFVEHYKGRLEVNNG